MVGKKKNSRRRGRRRAPDASANAVMARGIVTVAICSGASMWGYAMINLAT